MAKAFAVPEGARDGTALSGEARIDEAYFPVPKSDRAVVDGRRPRGLPRDQLCVGVGCDGRGRGVFIWEGRGKTSAARTVGAFAGRTGPGPRLVRDMEKSHRRLVGELGLADTAHDSREVRRLPDPGNPLAQVNHMRFLLKCFLRAHSGFDRDDLQGYLDVFHVMSNPPRDKMEKVAFVLDRAMANPKTLRFRDYYDV